MSKKKTCLTTRLAPGRKPVHGGYSFLATGKLPDHRRYVLQYLTAARECLIRDSGGDEEALTTAQLILVDRAIAKLGILRCMEEHIRETGVMRGNNLAPALGKHYIGYSNSLRLDLQALGIHKKAVDDSIDLKSYIREFDKRKARTEARAKRKAAKAQDPGEIIEPGPSGEAVFQGEVKES